MVKQMFSVVILAGVAGAFFILGAISPVNVTGEGVVQNLVHHKVKKKETVYSIAKMYGDTARKITQRNGLKNSHIYPGLVLKVETRTQTVLASWYGARFHGRTMANGKKFNMYDPTVVAHKRLPFGTKILVNNPENNRKLVVVVQDRGPYKGERELDLSMAAAEKLGMKEKGVVHLEYRVFK